MLGWVSWTNAQKCPRSPSSKRRGTCCANTNADCQTATDSPSISGQEMLLPLTGSMGCRQQPFWQQACNGRLGGQRRGCVLCNASTGFPRVLLLCTLVSLTNRLIVSNARWKQILDYSSGRQPRGLCAGWCSWTGIGAKKRAPSIL